MVGQPPDSGSDGWLPAGQVGSGPALMLLDRLSDANLTIVDVRPLAAFNGWRLKGEPQEGEFAA